MARMIIEGMPLRITIVYKEVMGIMISSNVIIVKDGGTSVLVI